MSKSTSLDKRAPEAIQAFRYPLFATVNFRGTSETKDQRFINCFPEATETKETGARRYSLIKRAGSTLYSTPKGAGGVARGITTWNSKVYCVIDNTIYSGTTNIGTIGTSTGLVSMIEMSQNAGTPYLCISDGQKLYLVSMTDVVSTIDNTQVQSVTITNPGTTTSGGASGNWGTSGGGGSGAAGTFTVAAGKITAVTITARGTGYTSTPTVTATSGSFPTGAVLTANLCAFPPNNIVSITYMDGYIFAGLPSGRIYNCDLGDPTMWQPSDYISAEMFPDNLVSLARQNNTVVAHGEMSTQFFYDAANATGSPLANAEHGVLQIGTVNAGCVIQHERFVTWIAKGETGGYQVVRLDGVSDVKRISNEPIERVLNAEGTNLATAKAYPVRCQGHFWYVLKLSTRTFLYDYDDDVWHEWESSDQSNFWGYDSVEFNNTLLILHATNGKIYTLDPTVYQDDSVDFTAQIVTSRVDMDTAHRKFMWKLELGCDMQSTSSPIDISYSDDDYTTWSTPRTVDTANSHVFLKRLGSFRRRAFKLSQTANTPMRLEYIEVEVEQGDY